MSTVVEKRISAVSQFKFRKNDIIGSADAADDAAFLSTCFVDSGDLEILRDTNDKRRIVVGRTGVGKTALLQRLIAVEPRTIELPPENLAFEYLSNSTILPWLIQQGVDLDLFFKLLWRHVLAIELLRARFGTPNEHRTGYSLSVGERIKELVTGNKKLSGALDYLRKWAGESFWQETDHRIREVTSVFEQSIKSDSALAAALAAPGVRVTAKVGGAATSLQRSEEKTDVAHRAQSIVNSIQMRELTNVLELVNAVLDDPQKKYFVVIDRLDERWVADDLKNLLLRALIETAKDFRKVQNAKIVIALRRDLFERVVHETRDSGFQAEKYRDQFLEVRWLDSQLRELVDRRVSQLVASRYTSRPVGLADLLPARIHGRGKDRDGVDYFVSRAMHRPRNAIMFFNECITKAAGEPQISKQVLLKAEADYSKSRLDALYDEWFAQFPNLVLAVELLRRRRHKLRLVDLCDQQAAEAFLDCCTRAAVEDRLSEIARDVCEQPSRMQDAARRVTAVLFLVGIVGLKPQRAESTRWSDSDMWTDQEPLVDDDTGITVHPAYRRALEVDDSDGR